MDGRDIEDPGGAPAGPVPPVEQPVASHAPAVVGRREPQVLHPGYSDNVTNRVQLVTAPGEKVSTRGAHEISGRRDGDEVATRSQATRAPRGRLRIQESQRPP